LLEKHSREPQIILNWSLNVLRIFGIFFRFVWAKSQKEENKPC